MTIVQKTDRIHTETAPEDGILVSKCMQPIFVVANGGNTSRSLASPSNIFDRQSQH
jgi:hypothetical protein